jgi:putative oxidoreductase
MDTLDVALLILRVWIGVVMVAHGLNHLRSQDGTARWFGKVGFRSPRLNARLSAYGELAIGAGLVVGLLTPVAAAGLGATMLVAFWAIHRHVGFFVFHRPDEGYEYVVTLAAVAFVLAILGPGRISIDQTLGLVWTGWAGASTYVAGLAAGAAQLIVFYRRPGGEDT